VATWDDTDPLGVAGGGVTVAVTVTEPAVGGVVGGDGADDPVQPPSIAATTTGAPQRAITTGP
jgi:hypothetical protein